MGEEILPFVIKPIEWEYGIRRRTKRTIDTVTGYYVMIYYNVYYHTWMIWLWSRVRGFIRRIRKFYICIVISGGICKYENVNKNIVFNVYKCREISEDELNKVLGIMPEHIRGRPRLMARWVREKLRELNDMLETWEREHVYKVWELTVANFGWQVQKLVRYFAYEVRSEPYYSPYFGKYFLGIKEWCRCDTEGTILRNTCRYEEIDC